MELHKNVTFKSPHNLILPSKPCPVKRLLTKIFKMCYLRVTIRNIPNIRTFLVVVVRRQFERHFARLLNALE